jgi:hypothetical protein
MVAGVLSATPSQRLADLTPALAVLKAVVVCTRKPTATPQLVAAAVRGNPAKIDVRTRRR